MVVEGVGRTGLPDCFERSVNTSELLEQAEGGVLAGRWLDVIDELLKLSPTISDPQQVAAGNPNRPGDADLRPPEPLPQAPQSRYPPAADPGPMNPEDLRRLSVYPHVEVEPAADVCPSGPLARRRRSGPRRPDHLGWLWVRTSAARQGERSKLRFRSWQWPAPPAHTRKGRPASMAQSCRDAMTAGTRSPFVEDELPLGGVAEPVLDAGCPVQRALDGQQVLQAQPDAYTPLAPPMSSTRAAGRAGTVPAAPGSAAAQVMACSSAGRVPGLRRNERESQRRSPRWNANARATVPAS